MGSRGGGARNTNKQQPQHQSQRWCPQPLAPLMEGPDPEMQEEYFYSAKKETSWDLFRLWFRSSSPPHQPPTVPAKRQDLRLLLGVLACPLAPIPIPHSLNNNSVSIPNIPCHRHIIKDAPIETSSAHYIIQQYMAATGCLKQEWKWKKNMYGTGRVKMVCCETEVGSGSGKSVKRVGRRSGESGCFVLWQMSPGKWSLELVVGGNKVIAGSDSNTVWRHTPWLGATAAKGPQRPLRRLIQGLDPESTARLFANAQCLGEKSIGEEDCFVLKVAADRATVMERSEGPAEMIRHVLYGYFSQKSGLLVYLEDSHLTRVHTDDQEEDAVYWETTIGSSIGDYRDVDGLMIAHQGRTIATVFRFGDLTDHHTRTKMEELWTMDDVVFNVPGLSIDYFIPPADIFHATHTHTHLHNNNSNSNSNSSP